MVLGQAVEDFDKGLYDLFKVANLLLRALVCTKVFVPRRFQILIVRGHGLFVEPILIEAPVRRAAIDAAAIILLGLSTLRICSFFSQSIKHGPANAEVGECGKLHRSFRIISHGRFTESNAGDAPQILPLKMLRPVPKIELRSEFVRIRDRGFIQHDVLHSYAPETCVCHLERSAMISAGVQLRIFESDEELDVAPEKDSEGRSVSMISGSCRGRTCGFRS